MCAPASRLLEGDFLDVRRVPALDRCADALARAVDQFTDDEHVSDLLTAAVANSASAAWADVVRSRPSGWPAHWCRSRRQSRGGTMTRANLRGSSPAASVRRDRPGSRCRAARAAPRRCRPVGIRRRARCAAPCSTSAWSSRHSSGGPGCSRRSSRSLASPSDRARRAPAACTRRPWPPATLRRLSAAIAKKRAPAESSAIRCRCDQLPRTAAPRPAAGRSAAI